MSPCWRWNMLGNITWMRVIFSQLEASIKNGDVQGFQLFSEVTKYFPSVTRKKNIPFKSHQEKKDEVLLLPSHSMLFELFHLTVLEQIIWSGWFSIWRPRKEKPRRETSPLAKRKLKLHGGDWLINPRILNSGKMTGMIKTIKEKTRTSTSTVSCSFIG